MPFRVVVSGFDELGPGGGAAERVGANALGKARDVAGRPGTAGCVVIGADTEVSLDDHTLGKPQGAEAAMAMLDALQGRAHQVHTGLALVWPGGEHHEVVASSVHMRPLSMDERRWYVDTGEWRERAGGYAIQGAGATLVTRIEGDHSAIVGLPVARLAELLERFGLLAIGCGD